MLESILQQYWNYPAFRPMQKEIVTAATEGKDVFALLPTGGGKSICYQVPALAQDGFCLVVSPLIALMQDQVMQLKKRGIEAGFVHSGMRPKQVHAVLENACNNAFKLLYVSPERLQSETFLDYAADFQLNLIAVDEAHCISQWGHDFRPAYRKIESIRSVFPEVPVLALTASANEQVQVDIMQQLKLKDPVIFRQSVVRENLFYHIRYTENKPSDINALFHAQNGSGILYCRSRKRCVEAAMQLRGENMEAGVYHAGMPREEREFAQQKWTLSHEQVICATTAFGMGIDKPDVRTVAHYDTPENIEEYYQEAGRAGRDGKKAHAVLFYNHQDIQRLEASTEIHYPPGEYLRKVYQLVGDYQKMATGEGAETLQPFDAVAFAHTFQLELLKTLSAIRLLDREGFWQWNENANTQTTVQFTTDRSTLDFLEKDQPALSYIAVGLLRLFGSVFHYPTVIREFEVSKMLRIEKPQLDMGLQRLAALGIIEYQPATAGGTLYWMHDRVGPAHFRLDMARINRLREAHEERVKKMIAYLTAEDTCRNVLLSRYFGEDNNTPCGGCDACKRNARAAQQPKDLKTQLLAVILKEQEISVQDLTLRFPEMETSAIISAVRTLSDESLCRIYPTGIIFAS